jgi:hypothetical protein
VSTLAARQAALVAALVAAGDVPDGFDPVLVRATRTALLRKRAGEVAAAWPVLAAAFGPRWTVEFGSWAAGRPPAGAFRDGWEFARSVGSSLPPMAHEELAVRVAGQRRYLGLGRVGRVVVVQVLGQVLVLRR